MRTKNFPLSIPIKGRVRICLEMVKEQSIRGKTVVDIGSSFGWLEKELQKDNPKRLVGIEPSEDAVLFARKYSKDAEFIIGDALNVPIENNIADVVCFFDVIEHLPVKTELKALKIIHRILKKNGVLLLSTPYDNFFSKIFDPAWYFGHRHYSINTILNLLKRTGFEIETLDVRGNIFSCLYLTWFYLVKTIFGIKQPRNSILERWDDKGYDGKGILDIFLIARKVN